jgi:CheY-like chemotaxis protein
MSIPPRVLVIDDDPSFRLLLAGLLKKHYEVITASSGEEGYQLALDHPPLAAIIDIQMPGWDGFETMRRFREHPDLGRIKTAVLTGDASRNTVVSAIRAGADEYLVKTNFSKEELLTKLETLVEKSSLWTRDESASRKPNPSPWGNERAGNVLSESESRLQEIIDGWE